MILVLKEKTTQKEMDALLAKLAWMSLHGVPREENGRYFIAIVNGADSNTDLKQFSTFSCVESVLPLTQKFKLAGREFKAVFEHLKRTHAIRWISPQCPFYMN